MDDLTKTIIDITRSQQTSKVVKCHWCNHPLAVPLTCDPSRDWPRHTDSNRSPDGENCEAEMRKHYT